MSWFWSSQSLESSVDKEVQVPIKKQISVRPSQSPNVIDELKNFHLNKTLTPVPKDNKPVQKKNEVWQEVLEIRKRVLKLESPDTSKKCLEDRVKVLEETVRRLEETVRILSEKNENNHYELQYQQYMQSHPIETFNIGHQTFVSSDQVVENYPMFRDSVVKQFTGER